ncbi:phage holin, lambda family [Salmonella enterica subsp. enterica serovar Reading]|nr:phage holin, lambda family [Salmonella enterica subsp. enterica serovar Reading]
MKMHNDPHSWQGWLELFQSWWRGDTPLGAVLMSLFMAGLRIAYFGGSGGWKKKTLEILLCGALTLTFSSALEYFGWPKSLSVAIGGGVGLNGIKTELVAHPDLLAQDTYAARSAAWFFATRGCQNYSGDLVRVTQIINGGQNGIGDRRERFEKAKSVLV